MSLSALRVRRTSTVSLWAENITYVPIDLDGIDKQYLNAEDVKQLNDYHKMVYEKISPYMTPEENEWLKEYTRAI